MDPREKAFLESLEAYEPTGEELEQMRLDLEAQDYYNSALTPAQRNSLHRSQ